MKITNDHLKVVRNSSMGWLTSILFRVADVKVQAGDEEKDFLPRLSLVRAILSARERFSAPRRQPHPATRPGWVRSRRPPATPRAKPFHCRYTPRGVV